MENIFLKSNKGWKIFYGEYKHQNGGLVKKNYQYKIKGNFYIKFQNCSIPIQKSLSTRMKDQKTSIYFKTDKDKKHEGL